MVNKNCNSKVPEYTLTGVTHYPVFKTLQEVYSLLPKVREKIDQQAFHDALEEIWRVIRNANQAIDESAPWTLRKTNPQGMADVLYTLMEVIRFFAIILQPFMPDSCSKILEQLSVSDDDREFSSIEIPSKPKLFGASSLKPGTKLPKPIGVFPRFSDDQLAD